MIKVDERKRSGEERRRILLQWLKESEEPLTGQILAEKLNVSRQVIVQDISLLKAKNEPIIATAQGYVYLREKESAHSFKRIIACNHTPAQTEAELNLIVDHGVFIRDVIIEHPIYGEMTASLVIKNRRDVKQFIQKMEDSKASYLSDLTEGTHLHTLEADTIEQLDEVCLAFKKAGFLLEKENESEVNP
ncbi:transcriptional regulator [Tepidibacillus decaturensis]|uniref:Transcriptional regulator n=1 Tax=Tepidibacillus decaturensis TaxID=1413211 RepID=A0A135L7W6_9BACI|nr:transcription repressor NadR [Tepidibacillus decaturensis]KXG45007.1 transcriptional regulator [Tepidibacillus decaturensis]